MTPYDVASRIQAFANRSTNDQLSNALARLADRVLHQGALFEAPLTPAETRIVKKFLAMTNESQN